MAAAYDAMELLAWVASHGHAVSGLTSALSPRVLLSLLSAAVPPACAPDPQLASCCSETASVEALATVYANACKRFGMRAVGAPQDQPCLGGSDLAGALANLVELRALLAQAEGGGGGSSSSSTPAPSGGATLSYAEHCALYTGRLGAGITPRGRERLWRYLLEREPAFVAPAGALRIHATAAARRLGAVRRGFAASASDDDRIELVHLLNAPGQGLLLVRRRLVRALVRAGLPPRVRGHLWARLAGGGDEGLRAAVLWAPFVHEGGQPALFCGAPASELIAAVPEGGAASQPCALSLLPLGGSVHPSADPPPPLWLTHYDCLLLANALVLGVDLLPTRFQTLVRWPARTSVATSAGATVAALLSGDRAAPAASLREASGAAIDEEVVEVTVCLPAWQVHWMRTGSLLETASTASTPPLTATLKSGCGRDSGPWAGWAHPPASAAAVKQIESDLRRTLPHLLPLESARCERTGDNAPFVQHVYSARHEPSAWMNPGCDDTASVPSWPWLPACAGQFDGGGEPPQPGTYVSCGALRRVLIALCSHAPLLGYCQGFNVLVAHALRWLGEADALCVVSLLAARMFPAGTFSDLSGATIDQRVLGEALLASMPALMELLARRASAGGSRGRSAALLFQDTRVITETLSAMSLRWFLGAFAGAAFPPAFTDRVWDSLFFEGPKTLFRTALALFRTAAPQMAAAPSFGEAIAHLELVPASTARPLVFAALLDVWVWPPVRQSVASRRKAVLAGDAATEGVLHKPVSQQPRTSDVLLQKRRRPLPHPLTRSSATPSAAAVTASTAGVGEAVSNVDAAASSPRSLPSDAPSTVESDSPALSARAPPSVDYTNWGHGVSGAALARLLFDPAPHAVVAASSRVPGGLYAPRRAASRVEALHTSSFGGGSGFQERAALHSLACADLGDAAVAHFYAAEQDSDGEGEDDEDDAEEGEEEEEEEDGDDNDEDEDARTIPLTGEEEEVVGDSDKDMDADLRGGGVVRRGSGSAPRSSGQPRARAPHAWTSRGFGSGGVAPSRAGGSGSSQHSSPNQGALAHPAQLRYGGGGSAAAAAAASRPRSVSSVALIANALGAGAVILSGGGADTVEGEGTDSDWTDVASLDGAPRRSSFSFRGGAQHAAARTIRVLRSHAGLVWREAQHISRGLVMSRRAYHREQGITPATAASPSLSETLSQLVKWADGERAPMPGDGDDPEGGGAASSPPASSPLKPQRVVPGVNGQGVRHRGSSGGPFAQLVEEGGDEEAGEEGSEGGILVSHELRQKHSVEPFAACHRLLSFFYRDARTGRPVAFGFALIEGYWPCVRSEAGLSGGGDDPTKGGGGGGDAALDAPPTTRVYGTSAPSDQPAAGIVAWDTPVRVWDAAARSHKGHGASSGTTSVAASNTTLSSWFWGAAPQSAADTAAQVRDAFGAELHALAAMGRLPKTLLGASVLGAYFHHEDYMRRR